MRGVTAWPGRPSAQELQVDRDGDGAATGGVGMKVVSAIAGRQEACRLTRVTQNQIGIDYTVERSARANPLIEPHACRFVSRRVEAGKARVAAHGRYGAAEGGQAVLVGSP